MKALKIIGCSDCMMWYSDLVGEIVPLVGTDTDAKGPIYWSREPAGYKNMVFQRDAVVVEVEDK